MWAQFVEDINPSRAVREELERRYEAEKNEENNNKDKK